MMLLEEQVISLEFAKKLKDLGVRQGSLFYWVRQFETDENGCNKFLLKFDSRNEVSSILNVFNYFPNSLSAFTISELSEMLPCKIKQHLCLIKLKGIWEIGYELSLPRFSGKNLANALSKMLIYLLENNLMENIDETN